MSGRADALVVSVFVASGAAGLIYQVVWARELVLIFGNTTEAIGAIVTAFMAGLGLGGLVGGLIAPRLTRPLRWYGSVELLVGSSALLVPVGFRLIEGLYRAAYDSTPANELVFMRLALSLLTVTPVTFLMGLTLPLLTRHMVTSMRDAGRHMGKLYSANTFGAMGGTLLSGFVLIELLGLSATAYAAVMLNLLAGGVALYLASRASGDASVMREVAPSQPEVQAMPAVATHLRLLVYVATFASGFIALALEILWTRMLAEGTGSRMYIFVLILAIYLFGIAGGGAIYRAMSSPAVDTLLTLGVAFQAIAAFTIVTVPLASSWIPTVDIYRALMLLPATICMGYAFPLSARLLTKSPAHGSRSIGLLYAWNTLGSILGSLAAAFVLAGTLGTNRSIVLLGGAEAAVALILILASTDIRLRLARPRRMWPALAGLFLVLLPAQLLLTGSPILQTRTVHRLQQLGLPLHHTEDRIATVDAVGGPAPRRRLFVGGTSMTVLSVDTKLMAYIPKVIRPNAHDFLDICFGMGTTFRSGMILGMHTDAVDLSPSVPLQMPIFYEDARQYLDSQQSRVITADGRNYVRLSSRQYDAISVDPPPPIDSAGTGLLYSREFYADARQRLRPDGVMLQWLYFGVNLEQLREHLRTFRSVFPHMLVLLSVRQGGLYMLGSNAPLGWDDSTVTSLLDSAQGHADIATAPDSKYLPQQPWSEIFDGMRWLEDGQVDRFTGAGPMITDDHPLTEYYALYWLFHRADRRVTEPMLRALAP